MTYDRTSLGIGGGIWIGGLSVVLATVLSLGLIISHKRKQLYPDAQVPLTVVIALPMAIGWSSWLILWLGSSVGVLEFFGDVSKSVVVVLFTKYVLAIIGWEDNRTRYLYNRKQTESVIKSLGQIPSLCKCFKAKSANSAGNFIKKLKFATYQYLFVTIGTFFLSLVLAFALPGDHLNYADVSLQSSYFWITIFKTLSMAYALYYVVVFGIVASNVQEIQDLKLNQKFLTVQISCLVLLPLGTLIGLLANAGAIADTTSHQKDQITLFALNLALCVESLVLAFVQILVFPASDYKKAPDYEKILQNSYSPPTEITESF